jgi:hypothetical protein
MRRGRTRRSRRALAGWGALGELGFELGDAPVGEPVVGAGGFQKVCPGPGCSGPVKMSSPLHLRKCLSRAYKSILAVVPPCARECRFIRVSRVLDAFQHRPGVGLMLTQRRSCRRGYACPGSSKRRIGWPVTSAIRSSSLSTCSTSAPCSSAVAAMIRSGIRRGCLAWPIPARTCPRAAGVCCQRPRRFPRRERGAGMFRTARGRGGVLRIGSATRTRKSSSVSRAG